MISTDDRDYIVDTFPLWDKLQPLNEVFKVITAIIVPAVPSEGVVEVLIDSC